MVSNCIMEIVRNFLTALQHSYFVDLLLKLYFVCNNGQRKNMAVIEANSNITCQRLSRGVCRDVAIMLHGMPGVFFLLMRSIHRFISKNYVTKKSKQTCISKNYEF